MIGPDSRYQDADRLFVTCHRYDEVDRTELGDSGEPLEDSRDTLYLLPTLPDPVPPELEYVANVTDTYDILAAKQLLDSRRWWVIADANNVRHPFDLAAGTVLRMPT